MPRGSSAYLVLCVDPSTGEKTLYATDERQVKHLEPNEHIVVSSYAATDERDSYLEAENLLFERYDEGAYDLYDFDADFLKSERPRKLGELRNEGDLKILRRNERDDSYRDKAINVL